MNVYVKYANSVELTSSEQLLAVLSDGTGYTGRIFNGDLKHHLKDKVHLSQGPITSHSFRAGLATMMAKAVGSDKDIQLIGR